MANSSMTIPQYLMSNDSSLYPANINVASKRNVYFSIFIMSISLGSGVLTIITRLKRPLKILLLNMVVCDVAACISGYIFGALAQMKVDSGNPTCTGTVFMVVLTITVSRASLAAITMNNFLAIFHPYKYNTIVTTRNILLTVAMLWIGTCLVSVGSVGFKLPANLPCAPLIAIPRYGVIIISLFILSCDLSAVLMNISLCIKLRKRRRVLTGANSVNPTRIAVFHTTGIEQEQEQQRPVHASLNQLPTSTSRLQGSSSSSRSGEPNQWHPTALSLRQSQQPSRHQHLGHQRGIILVKTAPGNCRDNRDSLHKSFYSKRGVKFTTVSRTLHPACFFKEDTGEEVFLWDFTAGGLGFAASGRSHDGCKKSKRRIYRSFLYSYDTSKNASDTNRDATTNTNSDRFRGLSVAMILIASWSCLMNVPFLTFMFYIGAIAENRTKANYGGFGVLATTFMMLNFFGGPVLYAWRFVNWTRIYREVRALCRRNHNN